MFSVVYLVKTNTTAEYLNITHQDPSLSLDLWANGCGIYSENSVLFQLQNSYFGNLNWAYLGGAISIYHQQEQDAGEYLLMIVVYSTYSKPYYNLTKIHLFLQFYAQFVIGTKGSITHTISNWTFTNNLALRGGAIYVENYNVVVVENCNFTSNTAFGISQTSTGEGGAIWFNSGRLISEDDETVTLEFKQTNIFTNNTAHNSGGAVYWNFFEPVGVDTLIFVNNTANLYGNDKACFAQNLAMTVDSARRQLTASTDLLNQKSGGYLPTITVYLKDKYGQVVATDSSSVSTISVSASSSSGSYSPILFGETTKVASNGVFVFSDITFTAEPGQNYSVSFSTDGIVSENPSNSDYLESLSTSSTNLNFTISLRTCSVGEAFSETGA